MTLQQLEYVLALDKWGNFAKAAFYCDVTQPTLSSMIQKLEVELGLKIFDRRRQPVVATKAGRAIISQAKEVLSHSRCLYDIAMEEKNQLTGEFTIAVIPTIAPYLIPLFFPQLMNEHPEMDVRIVELKTSEIKRALHDGDIDVGILADVNGLDDFDKLPLYSEKFYAYVSEGDPLFACDRVNIASLGKEYLWLLDEGHCFRDQLVKYCKLKSASLSKRAYRLGSIETFMRIVENGKGVTFIPELALAQLQEKQRKLVRPFALPEPRRQILAITPKTFIRHKLLDMLADKIRVAVDPLLSRY